MRFLALFFFFLFSCAQTVVILKEHDYCSKNFQQETVDIQGRIVFQEKLNSILSCELSSGYGFIFLPLADKSLAIVDIEKGSIIKRIFTDFFISSVAIGNETIYISGIGDWNAITAIRLRNFDKIFEKSADPFGGEILYCKKGLLFLTNRGKLFLIDSMSGKKIHEQNLNILPSGFTVKNDNVIVTSVDGNVFLLELNGLKIKKRINLMKKVESPPFLGDITIVCSLDGTIFLLDTMLSIISTTETNGIITSPPIADDLFIYCSTKDGKILKIDKLQGNILNTQEIESLAIVVSPVCAGNSLIIGTISGELFILDKKTLTIKNHIKLDGMIKHTPLVCHNKVFIVTEDGYLYGIE